MEKQLTQILFDFNASAEKDTAVAEPPVLEAPKASQPTTSPIPALIPKKTGSTR